MEHRGGQCILVYYLLLQSMFPFFVFYFIFFSSFFYFIFIFIIFFGVFFFFFFVIDIALQGARKPNLLMHIEFVF